MASARYTLNIKPEDLKPDEPRQLTRKEKLAKMEEDAANGNP